MYYVRQNAIRPLKCITSVILQYVRKNNYGYVNSDSAWVLKYLTIQFSILRESIVACQIMLNLNIVVNR